jgi:UDP-N-acetylmuramoylalanine--D-glutamate ligase
VLAWYWCDNVKTDWKGKRVTILGGARQGQAAARWLVRHGASVTINDQRVAGQMVAARTSLSDIPVTWVLGSHPLDLLNSTDILCLSGGIPLDNPMVVEAVSRKTPLTNDTQVFMEVVPCRTVGITGSAGKTTTTSLVGDMAVAAYGNKAYVGGNIGAPLLNHVDEMEPDDLAVLEISSFQLDQMTLSPNIAAILNITPNHLDRHGTMEAYTAAKLRILVFQGKQDTAVLCREDPVSWGLRNRVIGRLVSFGIGMLPDGQDGSYTTDGLLYLRDRGVDIPLIRRDNVQLRGVHNLMNILAAFAIGYAASLPLDAMLTAAEPFKGVAHRLEFVREWNGIQWYNDSIATAPERTMAAINSFNEPIVLLLGGRDKKLPWERLVDLVRQRVDHVILFGEAADLIASAFGSRMEDQRPYSLDRCKSLEEAVQVASRIAVPGSVVLLSPGGTSFDQFRDFEERGEAFRKWVSELL